MTQGGRQKSASGFCRVYMEELFSIALDGPVGAGKSSVADAVAERLHILHLDTGAMYRALGLACLEKGISPEKQEEVEALCHRLKFDVVHEQDGQHTLVDGVDVTGKIRTEAVSMAASKVATYPGVRREMVRIQQQLASQQSMLVDGRDIGTRVLPNATLKIFLTASDEVRAHRRYLQLKEKTPDVRYEDVLEDLRRRDEQDMHRETDPLRVAEDALTVDSSELNFQDTVQLIIDLVRQKHEASRK